MKGKILFIQSVFYGFDLKTVREYPLIPLFEISENPKQQEYYPPLFLYTL